LGSKDRDQASVLNALTVNLKSLHKSEPASENPARESGSTGKRSRKSEASLAVRSVLHPKIISKLAFD
jgi:hypothetical protein